MRKLIFCLFCFFIPTALFATSATAKLINLSIPGEFATFDTPEAAILEFKGDKGTYKLFLAIDMKSIEKEKLFDKADDDKIINKIINKYVQIELWVKEGNKDPLSINNYDLKDFKESFKKFKQRIADTEADGQEYAWADLISLNYIKTNAKDIIKPFLINKNTEEIKATTSALYTLGETLDRVTSLLHNNLTLAAKSYITGEEETVKLTDSKLENAEYKTGSVFHGDTFPKKLVVILLTFELIFMGIVSVMTQKFDYPTAFRKLIIAFVTIILVANLSWFSNVVLKRLFLKIGINLSGHPVPIMEQQIINYSKDEFFSHYTINSKMKNDEILMPSSVISLSVDTMKELTAACEHAIKINESKKSGILPNPKLLISGALLTIFFTIVKIVFVALYVVAALYIMLWIVQLDILILVAIGLLPFQIFKFTEFLAKGIWPVLFGQLVKMMVATTIIYFAQAVLPALMTYWVQILQKNNYNIHFVICAFTPGILASSILVFYFLLKAPSIAQSFIIGQPTIENGVSTFMKAAGLGVGGYHLGKRYLNNKTKTPMTMASNKIQDSVANFAENMSQKDGRFASGITKSLNSFLRAKGYQYLTPPNAQKHKEAPTPQEDKKE